ncbi:MAG: tripartite tricarboxylate transporter TctB family protein [Paracoccaceae bacterium]
MSVRQAELLMGITTLVISIAIMVKSAELRIGWVPQRGPGAGAWPFWLAGGMALASVATLVRWVLGATPEARSRLPYIPRDALWLVGATTGGLLGFLILIELIGTYFAVMIFMVFYLKLIGGHSWRLTLATTVAVPVGLYLLFEVALTKYLPKGLPIFEEAMLAVDDVRYAIQYSDYGAVIMAVLSGWLLVALLVALRLEKRGRDGLAAFAMLVAPIPALLLIAIAEPFGLSIVSLL